ncbi:MAG TPA: S8 family serine peptidase, partial [Tepidiformaceae bacterium]
MGKRGIAFVLLCAFALLSNAPLAASAGPPDPADTGSVIVKYEPTAAAQALQADGGQPSLADMGYRTLQVPPGMSRTEFMDAMRNAPGVVSVEADAPVYAAATPDDVYYPGTQSAYMNLIGAPAAWDLTTGSHSIVVAVLDSGTDLAHPDLSGRLWENANDSSSNGIDNDGNGCINDQYGCRFINLTAERRSACGYTSSAPTGAVLDDHGKPGSVNHSHGTLVAGILGAEGDNGIGTTGVAWDIRIMTVKVLDCGLPSDGGEPGGDISNVAQGIDYAHRMGANVISLSLASRSGDLSADTSILRDALQATRDAGVIVVAAAGNHSPGDSQVAPGYPAAYTQYPNLVAVGAADNLNGDIWANYSNYGPTIALAAPGNNLAGPIRTDLGFANPYGLAGPGTSFATPLVSGMFALMMSRNPRLSAADYIQIAKTTATAAPAGPPNWAGAGIINIGAAVARIPMTVSGSALKDWKDTPSGTLVTALVDGQLCGMATTTQLSGLSSYTIRIPSAAEQPGCGAPGKTVQVTVAGEPAFPAPTWGGQNASLGIVNWDISSISLPPGSVVPQVLGGGWSQLAH